MCCSATGLGPAGSGFFHVAPTLAPGGAPLPLAGLAVQTVLSKCLGPLERWDQALAVSRDAGYNAVSYMRILLLTTIFQSVERISKGCRTEVSQVDPLKKGVFYTYQFFNTCIIR